MWKYCQHFNVISYKNLDQPVRVDAIQFPQGGGRSVEHRRLRPGPEGGSHELLFPGGRGAPHSVDARMQPLPLARVETVLDRLPGLELTEPAAPTGLVFRKPDGVPVRWETA